MSQLPFQNLHQQLVDLRGQAKTWLAKGYAEGFVPTFGICNHLTLTPSDRNLLADLFASWPGSSGDVGFPVPHPTEAPAWPICTRRPMKCGTPGTSTPETAWPCSTG